MNYARLLSVALLCTACTRATGSLISVDDLGVHVSSSASSALSSLSIWQSQESERTSYEAYHEGVIGAGKPALLFFHVAFDPFCVKTDRLLRDLYAERHQNFSTYRVDFSPSAGLAKRYMAVTQDTLILVDGAGRKVAERLHPTRDDLVALLRAY